MFTVLYHVISCYIMLYHVISCYIMLYHVISCYIMLYHVISCYIMLYHVISCYIMLYHVISHFKVVIILILSRNNPNYPQLHLAYFRLALPDFLAICCGSLSRHSSSASCGAWQRCLMSYPWTSLVPSSFLLPEIPVIL